MLEVTDTTITERTQVWSVPDAAGAYLRVGRGTSGDSHHQDNEYMDDGEVRSFAVWDRVLTDSEMTNIVNVLDNKGKLIVE